MNNKSSQQIYEQDNPYAIREESQDSYSISIKNDNYSDEERYEEISSQDDCEVIKADDSYLGSYTENVENVDKTVS